MSNNMAPATQMKFFIKDTVWKVKYSEVTHSIKFQICNTMCIMIPIIAHKVYDFLILLQKVCLK